MYQQLAYDIQQALKTVEQAFMFVSLCNITRRPVTGGGEPVVSSSGWVDTNPSDYTPVTGLQAIPCMLAVHGILKTDQTGTLRMPTEYTQKGDRTALLDGWFGDNSTIPILQRDLATIDGVIYEIMAVESDSQHTLTRLGLRFYTK
jgi:hypothetical protein